jgi:hypothetical protein
LKVEYISKPKQKIHNPINSPCVGGIITERKRKEGITRSRLSRPKRNILPLNVIEKVLLGFIGVRFGGWWCFGVA